MPWELTCPVFLQQFDHHPMPGLRMDESHVTVDAPPGRLVNEGDAARAQFLHRRFDVVHGEADVMGAFPAPRQEPRRAALADGGRQKLNRAVSAVKKGYFHAVIRRVDPLQQPETENAAIGRKRIVQAMHNNADVIDLGVGELHRTFLFNLLH